MMVPALRCALAGAVWLLVASAHAQAPPSSGSAVNPTVGSVWTYLGPTYGANWAPSASGIPPFTFTDNKTAPQTTNICGITYMSYPGLDGTMHSLLSPGSKQYDGMCSIMDNQAGTLETNITGFGSYVMSNQPGNTGLGQNGVLYFGIGWALAPGSTSWGFNSILSDKVGGTGRVLTAAEYDFVAYNTTTTIQGIGVTGSSQVQPNAGSAYSLTPLNVFTGQFPWQVGFDSKDGAANTGLRIGALAASGPNSDGQHVNFHAWDASSHDLTYGLNLSVANGLTLANATGPATMQVNGTFVSTGSLLSVAGFRTVAGTGSAAFVAGESQLGPATNVDSQPINMTFWDSSAHESVVAIKAATGFVQPALFVGSNIGGTIVVAANFLAQAMPTSCAGLSPGTLWNSSGTVHVC